MKKKIMPIAALLLVVLALASLVAPAMARAPEINHFITIEIPVEIPDMPGLMITLTDVYDRYQWGHLNDTNPEVMDSKIFFLSYTGIITFSQSVYVDWRVDGDTWDSGYITPCDAISVADGRFSYESEILFVLYLGATITKDDLEIAERAFFFFSEPSENLLEEITIKGEGDLSELAVNLFGTDEIWVILDGKRLFFDVPPMIISDRTVVPLRVIFEALDAKVDWDNDSKTVTAKKDDTVVTLKIGDTSPLINGEAVTIDQPGVIVDGRTLVPLRFVAESFGVAVDWDGATRTVTITTPK